jgi:anti-anti-sigma regulatory factor
MDWLVAFLLCQAFIELQLKICLMFIQAHQEIVKKLVELIGITSIMEVCFWQHLFFVLLYIIFLLVFIVKLKMSKC